MRIFYLNPPSYDHLIATLVEGLLELGHEVKASEASNYAEKLPDADIPGYAELADLIVVGHYTWARHPLVAGVLNPRIVYVDGSDYQGLLLPDTIRPKLVFKRELNRHHPDAAASFLFPLPFAAERRYFAPAPGQRDILVSFLASLESNPLRHSVYQRVANLKHPQMVTGMTGERAYDAQAPSGLPMETPRYREALHRSVISISVPGLGYDCARFWEILAARAMLMSYEPDIVIPDGFTDGLDYVSFASLAEFEQKPLYYGNRPDLALEVAERGHRRLLAHYTTRARAAYFLRIVQTRIERPGHC